jgi:protein-disulfide isomerase
MVNIMKSVKYISFIGLMIALLICNSANPVSARRTLPKEIAPDVPAKIFQILSNHSDIYLRGSGKKEVLLIADPYCPNSRKTYSLLLQRMEYIDTVKVLLVCSLPHTGSDVVSAVVMRLHSAGKGESALDIAFKLEIPQENDRDAARQKALEISKNAFPEGLAGSSLETLQPELDAVTRNTNLAEEIDYTGTPHFIVGGRVLQGYSKPAIDIMLKQDL